jgi:dipeptidyl aminopeptidase/acylaminoacyl peptidase
MTSKDNPKPEAQEKPARPKRRITARALLEAKRLSDPRLHPDGRHVVFVVTEADFDESRYVSHLWLTEDNSAPEPEETPEPTQTAEQTTVGEEGSDSEEEDDADRTRQLTFSHDGESHPRWSPDGRFLAFLSSRPDESEPPSDDEEEEPKEQVWILPLEGGEARKLTSAKEGVLDYTWTPDSRAIVTLAPEPRPRPIESVRKEERNRRKVDPVVEHEDRLRRQFWRTDIEERKPKLLFTADYGVHEFALSPDGERLCYTTNYTGEWNDYHLLDLWVRDLTKGTRYKLVARAGGKYNLRWSPNGYQIAFLSWLDPKLSYSRESLFVAGVPRDAPPDVSAEYGPHAPGITDCRMLADLDYDLMGFEWSPHDDAIYALAAVGTATHVYRVHAETAEVVLDGPEEREDLSLDPEGGALVFVQESATALAEIFLHDEQGEIRPLTRLNAEFAETYRLPRREVIRQKSRDGLEVEAVVTYPLDYQEGTRVPLIVQVHGGPKGRATNILRGYTFAPVWSAEGYAVVQPNFRGSEGYGNAFAVANRRDLGGGDFDDILACVDGCIEMGLADPERIGIMGGSYGGYMTNWAIGHTDRFRAAVSMFGIFHLQTDYSNSELSRWDNEYLGAYYWEDPEIYKRLSPGSYIENIKTPTLIIHGDEDNNTFISNSKEMYQALRHRGVTTQFVHYPREGHGLREPNHKLDEVRRCLAWMDRYVRHGGQNPADYRIGDKVPNPDGRLELSVVRADIATFLGQPKPEQTEPRTALLEVLWTLHNRDAETPAAPVTVTLTDLRLEPRVTPASSEPPEPLQPIGVPLDVPGGKVLVEGENLRIAQQPDPETGQLAFAGAAVFRVPASGGDCLLCVGDFPPVAIAWTAEDVEEAEKEETPHEIPA